MLDSLEEKSPSNQKIDILGAARRRYWWVLIPLFLVWAITVIVVYLLPLRYQSRALILVARPSVPSGYVAPNVETDLAERLQGVTQQILSRVRLQTIIRDFHLYPDLEGKVGPEELVEYMRKDIHINPVPLDSLADTSVSGDPAAAAKRALMTNTGKIPDAIAFNISYDSSKPHVAQEINSQLISLFIEENMRERQQKSERTTGFLGSQMEDARKELQYQERRTQEFKTRYLVQLPAQMEGNVQILSGLQNRLQAADDAERRAQEQKLYLESLLAQYKTLRAAMEQGNGDSLHSPAALDRELERLRSQLADLSGHYTSRYPDVIHLKEQIEEAEKLKKGIETELARQQSQTASQGNPTATTGPISYSELQAMSPMLQVESQLASNKRQIENLENQKQDLQKSIEQYQARINVTPLREQELSNLTRDYAQSLAHYESLLDKRNQSQVATNLEIRQQGEQFVVLTSPTLPKQPTFPNRQLISLIGLGAGLVMGLCLGIVAELVDDRLRLDKEVTQIVAAPVLAGIPSMPTLAELRSHSRQRRLQWSAAALMICV